MPPSVPNRSPARAQVNRGVLMRGPPTHLVRQPRLAFTEFPARIGGERILMGVGLHESEVGIRGLREPHENRADRVPVALGNRVFPTAIPDLPGAAIHPVRFGTKESFHEVISGLPEIRRVSVEPVVPLAAVPPLDLIDEAHPAILRYVPGLHGHSSS